MSPLVSSSLSLMSALPGSPLSVSVLCSLAEVNLRTIWRRQLFHITTPCRQPDLVTSSTVVNGLSFGAVALSYSKGSAQGWGYLRALSGVWGILAHPSPSGWAYLQPTSFIGRIFLSLYTWGRRDLCSVRGRRDLCSVRGSRIRQLDDVRIWKLSRTYPGEKPPSLSVLTHRPSLAKRKPTRHLLAMPWILVRIGAPYESRWSTQFHLTRNYDTIFNSRFLKLFIFLHNSKCYKVIYLFSTRIQRSKRRLRLVKI